MVADDITSPQSANNDTDVFCHRTPRCFTSCRQSGKVSNHVHFGDGLKKKLDRILTLNFKCFFDVQFTSKY